MPESHTFGPEQPDDNIDAITPKKRRGSSALSRYLFQRRSAELTDTTDESQETDKETGEKPKRLKGLLGKIFPKIVEKSEIADQPKKEEFDPEMFFSWSGPVEQENVHDGAMPDAEHADSSRVIPEGTAAPSTSEPVNSPNSSERMNITEIQEQSSELLTDRETPTSIEEVTPIAISKWENQPSEADRPVQLQEQLVQRPESQSYSNAVERETIIDRRGSALPYVLLGAEYMARKSADKKLEQRVTSKITETSAEVSRAAQLQQELDRVVRQNREQLEALKQQRQMPEVAVPVERSNPAKTEVETQPDPTVLRIERSPAPNEKDQPETVQRKIFEQVAEAAEQNVPVERVFERSHEVKDDKTTPVGAASVGAVMAAKAAQSQVPQTIQASQVSTVQADDLPVVVDRPGSDEYRQAMKAGFWSAVMIIIVGSIAYLMLQ